MRFDGNGLDLIRAAGFGLDLKAFGIGFDIWIFSKIGYGSISRRPRKQRNGRSSKQRNATKLVKKDWFFFTIDLINHSFINMNFTLPRYTADECCQHLHPLAPCLKKFLQPLVLHRSGPLPKYRTDPLEILHLRQYSLFALKW